MYAVLRILEPGSSPGRKDLLRMAGLGCFGVVVAQTSFTFGVSMTTAANTGLIFATAPVWGLLLGLLLGLERPTWRGAAGVGLSSLGVGVIFYEALGLEGASLIGDLLVLLAAMGFGAYTVLSMRVLGRYSPLAVATYPILFGAPLVLLVSVLHEVGVGGRRCRGMGRSGLLGDLRHGVCLLCLADWRLPHRGQPGPRLPVPDLPHGGRFGHRLFRGDARV
jgi:drug/metabolite transporter (DMT)-like permease